MAVEGHPQSAPDAVDGNPETSSSSYTRDDPPIRTLLACFYSFKGGVGRSQSLTAIGHLLAQRNRKALLVDLDLEAPGISVAHLDSKARESQDGFLEICRDLSRKLHNIAEGSAPGDLVHETARQISDNIHSLALPVDSQEPRLIARLRKDFPQVPLPDRSGSVHLLSCGRIYQDYIGSTTDLRLPELLACQWTQVDSGQQKPLLLAANMDPEDPPENLLQILVKVLHDAFLNCLLPGGEPADYVLIDSRAGLADIGGLCVRGLADYLVILSGLNRQNLEGTRWVLDRYRKKDRSPGRFTAVLSPVPDAELELLDARLKEARTLLDLEEDPFLFHYQPRVALLEETFVEPFHRNSQLARDYLRLCSRLQQAKRDNWLGLATHGIQTLLAGEGESTASEGMKHVVEAACMSQEDTLVLVENAVNHAPKSNKPLHLLRLLAAAKPDEVAPWGILAQQLCQAGLERIDSGDVDLGRAFIDEALVRYAITLELEDDPSRTLVSWGNNLGEFAQRLWDLGEVDDARARYEEAFARYEQALQIKPDLHEALYNWGNDLGSLAPRLWDLGEVDDARSRYKEAFARYERALQVKPDKHEALNNWGNDLGGFAQRLWDVGDVDEARVRYEEAFPRYERALQIKPDKHEALYNWGYCQMQLAQGLRNIGEEEHAVELFQETQAKLEKAEELRPGAGAYNLACLMSLTDRPDEAFSWLEKAIESDHSKAAYAQEDSDFDSIRDDPRFAELVRSSE